MAWRRSRKGNLYNKIGADTVTIFKRGGVYRIAISRRKNSVTFPPGDYPDEGAAVTAVIEAACELGIATTENFLDLIL